METNECRKLTLKSVGEKQERPCTGVSTTSGFLMLKMEKRKKAENGKKRKMEKGDFLRGKGGVL